MPEKEMRKAVTTIMVIGYVVQQRIDFTKYGGLPTQVEIKPILTKRLDEQITAFQ